MNRKVLETIRSFQMFSPGERIVVGLSGGADSVTLLHLLCEMDLTLLPCHINHNLRGEEAMRDQRFCEELCGSLGLSLRVFSEDAAGYAREHGMSLEEGARDLRYRCFREYCAESGAKVIAVAHTLSDSAETVLFSLARGTGLSGLCGIPPVRMMEDVRIVRPLIECTREDIESYCRYHSLSFVTDSTNLSDDYTRNKIRHQLLPLLETIHPSAQRSIGHTIGLLRQDRDYLEKQADAAFECLSEDGKLQREPFLKMDPALQGRVLLRLADGIFCDRKKLSLCLEAAEKGRGAVELAKDVFFRAQAQYLYLEHRKPAEPFFSFVLDPLQTQWQFEAAGKRYYLRVYEQTEKFENFDRNVLKKALDYDTIYGIVELRQKTDGDVCAPVGRAGSRSLKKLYQDAKLPPEERKKMAVLADENGVLWAEGFGTDRRAAVRESTKRILEITVEPME